MLANPKRFSYTYWISERPIVAVTDYNVIMESFQKDGDAYAGRPTHIGKQLDMMTRGRHICILWVPWFHLLNSYYALGEPRGGVVFTEGDLWREHRRFALHVLRDFGLSNDLMQERVSVNIMSAARQ